MTAPDKLSLEDESTLEKNLVWIFGSPRSGTTWTSSKLLSHKTLRWEEPLLGSHIADSRELGQSFISRIEEHSHREHYFFCQKHQDIWQYYLRKLILHRIYAQFKDLTTKIIIKEPNGSMAADIISACLPNSKILIILRDGRDVINSQITALSEGGYAVKVAGGKFQPLAGERRRITILMNSRKWKKLVEILMNTYQNHNKNLRYIVRYEDLLENTFDELLKLYQFIDIPIEKKKIASIISESSVDSIPSELKGIGTTVQFAKAGAWNGRFDDKEIALIQEVIGDKLANLGYLK